MEDVSFLALVQQKGQYRSKREASCAVNAVFGTLKSWISPAASSELNKLMPDDASRLWNCSPVSCWSDVSPGWQNIDYPRMLLRIQQIGRYSAADEAIQAYGAVMAALKSMLPVSIDLVIGKRIPSDSSTVRPFNAELGTMVV